jgi:hypothetical protein
VSRAGSSTEEPSAERDAEARRAQPRGDDPRVSLAPWVVKAQRIGAYDENWPDWYSAYMVAEQSGAELPT